MDRDIASAKARAVASAEAAESEAELQYSQQVRFFNGLPYVIGQTIIFLPCGFYISSLFLLLSVFHRLISAV